MNVRGMKARRASMGAKGLAMSASDGLTGAGAASVTTPGLKVTPGLWTQSVIGGDCEVDTMASNGTWTARSGRVFVFAGT
jgi:hypothetical protein